MKASIRLVVLIALIITSAIAHGDSRVELQPADEALRPAWETAGALVVEGKLDEANANLLATFPERTRTAAQAFILANVLFQQDPKTSYALHKRAAAEFTDDPMIEFEWAMEQHRAKEYAEAAASYIRVLKSMPDNGPILGLLAECQIRTGDAPAAADSWRLSEQGKLGEARILGLRGEWESPPRSGPCQGNRWRTVR